MKSHQSILLQLYLPEISPRRCCSLEPDVITNTNSQTIVDMMTLNSLISLMTEMTQYNIKTDDS